MCWCEATVGRSNQKTSRRIYREPGLQFRNKSLKLRVKAKLRDDRKVATQPNETWAMDFVHDQLAAGKERSVWGVSSTACDRSMNYEAS
jgi:putative transposase